MDPFHKTVMMHLIIYIYIFYFFYFIYFFIFKCIHIYNTIIRIISPLHQITKEKTS